MANPQIVPPGSADEMTAANEANWLAVWRLLATTPLPGVQGHDDADSVWFLTGLPYPLMNAVVRAELPAPGRDDQIAALLAPFQTRQVPMLWYVWPSPSSADDEAALLAHGLRSAGTMPAMAMDLASLPAETPIPPGVTIETVDTPDALPSYVDTLMAGNEMPDDLRPLWFQLFSVLGVGSQAPLRHYVARLNGEPVTAATLVPAAGVAGIYNVATVPHARRRGIGAAATLQALRDARDEGFQVGVLQSSSMGHPIYEAMGFRDCCTVGELLWTPQSMETGEPVPAPAEEESPRIRQGFLSKVVPWWRRTSRV